MATSWISDLLFALFVFMLCVHSGSCQSRKFISWDDIRLDGYESTVINDRNRKVELRRNRVIVVDKNGGGDSATVQGAVDMVPEQNNRRVKIHILPGTYREKVTVPSSKPYVSFIGNASFRSATKITWHDKASDRYIDDGSELGTYRTASVNVEGDYFCATGITIENTVVAEPGGKGEQAVALRVAAERSLFYKVRILGSQDTLFDESGTHYFYRSYIRGSIDFICGMARSLFQRCVLESVANGTGAIAAHHRQSPDDGTGFSFVNCSIVGTGQVDLGRAWGVYSRTIYSYCYISDIISPQRWSDWGEPQRRNTTTFSEYECNGRGAQRGRHRGVPWTKRFDYEEVRHFLGRNFIDGNEWLRLQKKKRTFVQKR